MNSNRLTVMDEQWQMNSKSGFSHFWLKFFEESSVEFKGLQIKGLSHIIGVLVCQKKPIKRNQWDHPFKSIVFLCQMSAIIGKLQKHRIGGKQDFSSGKYWSVLAVVLAKQIGESKSSAKSGVSWNSSRFSATYSLKTLKHFGLCASQTNKGIIFISETWQEFFW